MGYDLVEELVYPSCAASTARFFVNLVIEIENRMSVHIYEQSNTHLINEIKTASNHNFNLDEVDVFAHLVTPLCAECTTGPPLKNAKIGQ